MDFVRNALESNRDTSIVGQGEAFKTKRLNVNNAMPRDYYRYGDAKLLQSDRQCAQNIGQTARLGEGRTFCSNHQNAKVGHGELSYPFTSSRARCVARTTAKADRKSTRLNSSHSQISYAVFCLKKKKDAQGSRRLDYIIVHCYSI